MIIIVTNPLTIQQILAKISPDSKNTVVEGTVDKILYVINFALVTIEYQQEPK